VQVEVGYDGRAALVSCGLLQAWNEDDPAAIGRAIEDLLALVAANDA
jgi:hypothetical protein